MTDQEHAKQIRQLIDSWSKAVACKDVEAIMQFYSPPLRAFDAIGPLQFQSRDAYQQHWQHCMTFCPGEFRFEVHQLEVQADTELAFCHFLNYGGGTDHQGQLHLCWLRCTQCWQLQPDGWKIIHEHFSVPVEMGSGQGQFDLKPDDER
ncbi:YybH family protein [Alkalimonas mucilaginosa]|uniref:Nuclear transport factor 2 family protein n=1 Tax=Alkalimonas mucilaginosa TaxID=3057676 RepID=A0ABU7JFW4_9GAMM|nr:nuclear transport factor 2 family protein [Alkalimonas sp. MEB004]MEE2024258.1 nuclear transport factor 2 family protein [Alkalimonas sp. MEB004]